MKSLLITLAIAILVSQPVNAQANDGRSILDEVMAKDMARKKGVNFYVVRQKVMGQTVAHYFERTEVQLEDGSTIETFRMVPSSEMNKRKSSGGLTPAQAEAYAQGAEMTGQALSSEMDKGMQAAGLPPGMLSGMGSPDEPWASPDPKVMMGAGAGFVRAAGQAGAEGSKGQKNAEEAAHHMAQFAETAKLVGKESVDGSDAFHLCSDNIDMSDMNGSGDFDIETFCIWISTDDYVPLKMRMEGTATERGQSRDVFMEQHWLDYREVPGSSMYESYKRISKMGGVLSPKEEAQMAEAREQMAEFEEQLASMPESQRKMMENMMGSRMDSMRKMMSSGAYEIETDIEEIAVIR